MLRVASEGGWWLVTHVDHAGLAGAFAERWGGVLFRAPEPRQHVLAGIARHDDGWRVRDAAPGITREGKPSAFSKELVGKYSAFEEIDLEDYLAVRDRAVRLLATEDAYAAILVSMHTLNLLTERADRSTIQPAQLFLLDDFIEQQRDHQLHLIDTLAHDARLAPQYLDPLRLRDHFRLLQACDNLSLLACVDYRSRATLLHELPRRDGSYTAITVYPAGPRTFRLEPYPFDEPMLTFTLPASYVEGSVFASAEELNQKLAAAPKELLTITVGE